MKKWECLKHKKQEKSPENDFNKMAVSDLLNTEFKIIV